MVHSHKQAGKGPSSFQTSASLVVRPLGSKGVVELGEGELAFWHNLFAPRLIGPTRLGSMRECPEESQEKGGVPVCLEINSTHLRSTYL